MSGVEHARVVAPIAKELRARESLNGQITNVINRVARDYATRLPLAPETVDLRSQFFSPYPMTVICELMAVDQPEGFRTNYGDVVAGATSNVNGDPVIHARAEKARTAVFELLRPVVQQRTGVDQASDLLSRVCALVTDGTLASEDSALSYALFLFIAGVETTERTLTNLMAKVVDNPILWDVLRADRTLVLPAIVETLRLFPPVQAVSRSVAEHASVSGVDLQPGDRVFVVMAAANRDETVFDDPDVFDVRRFLGRESREFTPASEILTFGTGIHHCTGSMLARLEMVTMIDLLLNRIAAVEHAGEHAPEPRGYVLRAPKSLLVRMVAAG